MYGEDRLHSQMAYPSEFGTSDRAEPVPTFCSTSAFRMDSKSDRSRSHLGIQPHSAKEFDRISRIHRLRFLLWRSKLCRFCRSRPFVVILRHRPKGEPARPIAASQIQRDGSYQTTRMSSERSSIDEFSRRMEDRASSQQRKTSDPIGITRIFSRAASRILRTWIYLRSGCLSQAPETQ